MPDPVDPILHGIRMVAGAHLGHQGDIEPTMDLVEVLQLDSVRMLTLVMELENHFRVNLEAGDELGLVTVGDLAQLLRRRLDAG